MREQAAAEHPAVPTDFFFLSFFCKVFRACIASDRQLQTPDITFHLLPHGDLVMPNSCPGSIGSGYCTSTHQSFSPNLHRVDTHADGLYSYPQGTKAQPQLETRSQAPPGSSFIHSPCSRCWSLSHSFVWPPLNQINQLWRRLAETHGGKKIKKSPAPDVGQPNPR